MTTTRQKRKSEPQRPAGPKSRWVTAKFISRMTGMSLKWVYRMEAEAGFPKVFFAENSKRKTHFFVRAEVEEWLEKQEKKRFRS